MWSIGDADGVGEELDIVSAEGEDADGVELQPARVRPRARTATPIVEGTSAVLRMIAPFLGDAGGGSADGRERIRR